MRSLVEISLVYLVGFFTPINPFLLSVGFFIVSDMILGIIVSKKNNEFSAKKLYKTIPKFITYGICIITTRVVEILYFPEFPATKLISGLILYTEMVSMDEKIKVITGKSFLKLITDKLNFRKNK